MKIADLQLTAFRYRTTTVRDYEGHPHIGDEHWATNKLLTVVADNGAEGHFVSGGCTPELVEGLLKPALLGEDPFFREMLHQRMQRIAKLTSLGEAAIAQVDNALWDLAGRHLGVPVYKMLGASRTKVLAYASTMPGDDTPGGLSTIEEYCDFAQKLVAQGYQAIKLHTWMPPVVEADVKQEAALCAGVREAVGPDVDLMLDAHHHYDRQEALYLAKECQRLGYVWIEEPMNETRLTSYVWLAGKLDDLAICGPENSEGGVLSRVQWAERGATDMLRAAAGSGGITQMMKTIHLAEAYGLRMEVHGGGPDNMHALCAMGINGKYYERGLVHPLRDFEVPFAWQKSHYDPLDADGYVHVPERPGLGDDIDFEFIAENAV